MKLITRDTDYAVRALSCIAAAGNRVVSVKELTGKLKIPKPFLRKILQVLNKKRILKSYKGKGGGFALAVPPQRISLTGLMDVFQGPFCLNEHIFKRKVCPDVDTCELKKRIDVIEKMVYSGLKKITIAALLKKEKKA